MYGAEVSRRPMCLVFSVYKKEDFENFSQPSYVNLYVKYLKPNNLIILGFTASLNIRRFQIPLFWTQNLIQNRIELERLVREDKIYFEKLCIAFKTYHSG
jgi:hypothetical protein